MMSICINKLYNYMVIRFILVDFRIQLYTPYAVIYRDRDEILIKNKNIKILETVQKS